VIDFSNWPDGHSTVKKLSDKTRVIRPAPNHLLAEAGTIIVIGTDHYSLLAIRELNSWGIKVSCVCDISEAMSSKRLCGIPVVGLTQLMGMDKDAAIVINHPYVSVQIEEMLRSIGFRNILLHANAYDTHVGLRFYLEGNEKKQEIAKQNRDKIEYTLNRLADDHSKAVFNAAMELWLRGEYIDANKTVTRGGYFPRDLIELGNEEVFVDCGAYTGDSVMQFAERVNGNYRAIYGYEADELNCEIANHFLALNNITNARVFNIGVYSSKTTLCFSNTDGEGNRIVREGGVTISADTLDNLLKDRPHPVTFLKMDIEGAEMDALLGANEIINTDAPKLAISAYHKLGDIWEIPYYIFNNFRDYKVYLRNGHVVCEYICFALKA